MMRLSIMISSVGWSLLSWCLSATAQVQLNPPNPRLGYTVSVDIIGDYSTQPTVAFEDKIFQAFPVSPQTWRAFIPTSPLDQPGPRTLQVNGLPEPQTYQLNLEARDFPVQRITLPPSVAGLQATQLEWDRVNQFRYTATPQKYWSGPFQPPSQGPVTTIFGVRRYYNGVFANNYYHRGIDYAGPWGSVVVAPAAGRVAVVGLESEGFRLHGNMVGLDHGHGVTSVFLHLSRIDVQEGLLVEPGQALGAIGATGVATGPHLHWGLFVNGVAVDPVPWMNLDVR